MRQGGNNVGVLRSMGMPRAVLFAANEEENPLARLADAAVGLDLADQFPLRSMAALTSSSAIAVLHRPIALALP